MAVAAYTMAILVVRYAVPMPLAAGAGLIGGRRAGTGAGAFRHCDCGADYLAIATVAGGEIVRYLAMNLPDPHGWTDRLHRVAGARARSRFYNGDWLAFLDRLAANLSQLFGAAREPRRARPPILVWLLAGMLVLVLWRCERSPWGRVLRGIREDEAAVQPRSEKERVRLQAAGR